jgi:2-polyprenyl-3-methyl-5-hydroxy-6-metoxy-1,4-benzoquinol methylase
VICPACRAGEGHPIQRHSVEAAAEHFVPRARDETRHRRLVEHLRALWDGNSVEVQRCDGCGFGFAVPWVGGDTDFYALAHAGDPHYPRDRWEFGETLSTLALWKAAGGLRVLEVGAGDGAFLDRLRALPTGRIGEIVAADLDAGACRQMRNKGYEAVNGSLSDVASSIEERFDVVCLFQTLEHMASVDAFFADLRKVLAPDGAAFVAVPDSEATSFQERATGLWDMPPNHVARWTPSALERAAGRCGFQAVEVRRQPVHVASITRQLAVMGVNARSYVPGTAAARVNAMTIRPLRGALKRMLALSLVPGLLAKRQGYRPLTVWAHLEPVEPSRSSPQ